MEAFINATLRFKKVDICHISQGDIQFSELVVMDKVLGCGCHSQCLNIVEIQESLYVSKPAISQILNSLERKGYIVRQIGPGDRRKINVTATDAGKRAMEQARDCCNTGLQDIFDRYGLEETLTLIRQLHRLADICDQLRMEREP